MSLLDYQDGLHLDVPPETYHERHMGLVSNGALSELERSPLHYLTWVNGQAEDEETRALTFGRAWHTALLEPERFTSAYACEPDFGDCRKKENKAARDAWRADHAGREFVGDADFRTICGMARSVRSHPLASKMLTGGVAEATLLWTDPETGLRCRARSDYFVRDRGIVLDIKSTEDASPRAFMRSVLKYGYHRQHAHYRSGFAALGIPAKHMIYIAVEKSPPYAVATYVLDEKAIGLAHEQIRSLMKLLRDCIQTDIFPGYPVAIHTLDTPPWAA